MRRVSIALAVSLVACGNGKSPGPSRVSPSGTAVKSGTAATKADAPAIELTPTDPSLPRHALRRFGSEALRHPSGLGLQATPDGTRLMSRSQRGEHRIWDTATGAVVGSVDAFEGALLLPDGKRVITDTGVHAISGEVIATTPASSRGVVAGNHLVLWSKPNVGIYDASTLASLGTFKIRGEALPRFALSPDGAVLAVGMGSAVTTYTLPAGKLGKVVRFDGDVDEVTFVGADKIAVAPALDRVVVHDLVKDTRVLDWKRTGEVVLITELLGTRDGQHIVVTINGIDSQILDVATKTTRALPTLPSVGIAAAELTGQVVAVQTTDSIRLYEIATAKAVAPPVGHLEQITGLAFTANGKALLSGSEDGTVLRWNLADGTIAAQARLAKSSRVEAIALSPDGRYLAAAGHAGDVLDATTLTPLTTTDHLVGQSDVAWLGGKTVHVGGLGSISVGPDTVVNGDCGMMYCQLAVTNTGAVAFGTDTGQQLIIGDSFAATAKSTVDVCGYLRALDRTATRVAFVGDSCAQLYDAKGTLLMAFEMKEGDKHTQRMRHAVAVAFSPDGSLLATGWESGLVEIRDAASGAVKKSLPGHRDDISALAFSADNKLLASGTQGGTILIWQAN